MPWGNPNTMGSVFHLDEPRVMRATRRDPACCTYSRSSVVCDDARHPPDDEAPIQEGLAVTYRCPVRRRRTRLGILTAIGSLLVASLSAATFAMAQSGTSTTEPAVSTPKRQVEGNRLISEEDPAIEVRVTEAAR